MTNKIILSAKEQIRSQVEAWNNFSRFPLKGELWEERLSLGLAHAGHPTDWEPDGNHKPGVDLTIVGQEISFSCKSGKLKNGVLSISSYRTTKQKTLQEKLDYHDSKEAKPFSHYAVLVRTADDKKQICLIIEKDYINAKNLSWEMKLSTRGKNKGTPTGWSGSSKSIDMKIQKAMSDQFWYYLDWESLVTSDKATILFTIEK